MILKLHCGIIFIFFISVFSFDYAKIVAEPNPIQLELTQRVLYSLKKFIPEFKCIKHYNNGIFDLINTPGFNVKANFPKVDTFLLIDPKIRELTQIEWFETRKAINDTFSELENSRVEFMKNEGITKYSKTYEFCLFENMYHAIPIIIMLDIDLERIKNIENLELKLQACKIANLNVLNLYNLLLYIRFTHFMDFVTSDFGRISDDVKFKLADNIYSMSISKMIDFMKFSVVDDQII